MKSKTVIIIFFVLLVYISVIYGNYFAPKMNSGKYVYNFPVYVVDGPNTGDYLFLKENGTFESNTWGNGTYEINGSKLAFNYKYEMNEAGFECRIY